MSVVKGNQGRGQGDPVFDVQEARHGAMGRKSEKTDACENMTFSQNSSFADGNNSIVCMSFPD